MPVIDPTCLTHRLPSLQGNTRRGNLTFTDVEKE